MTSSLTVHVSVRGLPKRWMFGKREEKLWMYLYEDRLVWVKKSTDTEPRFVLKFETLVQSEKMSEEELQLTYKVSKDKQETIVLTLYSSETMSALQDSLKRYTSQQLQTLSLAYTSARGVHQAIEMTSTKHIETLSEQYLHEMEEQPHGLFYFLMNKHHLLSLCGTYERHGMGEWDRPVRAFLFLSDILWGVIWSLATKYISRQLNLPLPWYIFVLSSLASLVCSTTLKGGVQLGLACPLACLRNIFLFWIMIGVTSLLLFLISILLKLEEWTWGPLLVATLINIAGSWIMDLGLLLLWYALVKRCCPSCTLDDAKFSQVDAGSINRKIQQQQKERLREEQAQNRSRIVIGTLYQKVEQRLQ